MQRRLGLAPVGGCAPRGPLELMLHVEQPDADGRGEHDDRQGDHEKGREPTLQTRMPAASSIPALVVIVLTHGIAPLRMKPKGKRFSIRNR